VLMARRLLAFGGAGKPLYLLTAVPSGSRIA
jgi:hypothetical protein